MKQLLDTNALTSRTGDPFADVGGMVIDFFLHFPQTRNKTILQLIDYAADIYINNWEAKLHPFFLNSTITQAQFIGERKKQETLDYFSALLDESFPGKHGFCEISGRKTKIFAAGRNNQILSGSGTFVNYHSNLQPAIYLSKEVLIRIFFVPLGVHRLADKLAVVTSNNSKVSEFFVFQNCINNLTALKTNVSTGPLKSIFRNPANALFRFVDDYISYLDKNLNSDENNSFDQGANSLAFYHFSNLGQKPEMVLHTMNNEVFAFYTYCNTRHKADWQLFVRAHYNPDNLSKSFFNEETQQWQTKEGEEITFSEYQKWKNFVLHALLNNFSLVKYFLRWNAKHVFPFDIVKTYLISFRNMKMLSVEKIESIATLIVGQDVDYIEEMINSLNGTMSRAELRKIFLDIQSVAHRQKAKEALISAEDYVEYLLPPGASWSELRDVLVISIYHIANQSAT